MGDDGTSSGTAAAAAASGAPKELHELGEFLKSKRIPEIEHAVLTLQGVSTIAEFSRAISSPEELEKEILAPLREGEVIGGVTLSTTRKPLSLKASWTIAWEDASTTRNAQISADQIPFATPAPKTEANTEEAADKEERAPKRLKPGEFSGELHFRFSS